MDYRNQLRELRKKQFYKTYNSFVRGYFKTEDHECIETYYDYNEITRSKVYLPEDINFMRIKKPSKDYSGTYLVENTDSFTLAKKLGTYNDDEKVLVLNFANGIHPGGGVRRGSNAQEEDLCRNSSLLLALEHKNAKLYYDYNSALEDEHLSSDAVIVTPTVEYVPETGHSSHKACSVITCAAPDLVYMHTELTDDEYHLLMLRRIKTILYVAIKEGYKRIVLGAWGCGAFRHDPNKVAPLFSEALSSTFRGKPIENYFDIIAFAVLSKKDTTNFDVFHNVFKDKVVNTRFLWLNEVLDDLKNGHYGEVVPMKKINDGMYRMGHMEYNTNIYSLIFHVNDCAIYLMKEKGIDFYKEFEAIKDAINDEQVSDYSAYSLTQVFAAMVVIIRQERFSDGLIMQRVEDGTLYQLAMQILSKSENGEEIISSIKKETADQIKTDPCHINIVHGGILDLDTDAVVNAANEDLQWGGGICGAIFESEGGNKLQDECDKIGHCNTGDAVYTPGFGKYHHIIHAVGPRYHGGHHGEKEALYNAYQNSLKVAKEHNLHSISFPLISSGIFGYPVKEAWEVAIKACNDFIAQNDYPIEIYIINNNALDVEVGKAVLKGIDKNTD